MVYTCIKENQHILDYCIYIAAPVLDYLKLKVLKFLTILRYLLFLLSDIKYLLEKETSLYMQLDFVL